MKVARHAVSDLPHPGGQVMRDLAAGTLLVPKFSQFGNRNPVLGVTTAGNPPLRELLFAAADQALRTDIQMPAKLQVAHGQ